MAYTCAAYPDETSSLEDAQFAKHALVADKLALKPGMRLLDVGLRVGRHVDARRRAPRRAGPRA